MVDVMWGRCTSCGGSALLDGGVCESCRLNTRAALPPEEKFSTSLAFEKPEQGGRSRKLHSNSHTSREWLLKQYRVYQEREIQNLCVLCSKENVDGGAGPCDRCIELLICMVDILIFATDYTVAGRALFALRSQVQKGLPDTFALVCCEICHSVFSLPYPISGLTFCSTTCHEIYEEVTSTMKEKV